MRVWVAALTTLVLLTSLISPAAAADARRAALGAAIGTGMGVAFGGLALLAYEDPGDHVTTALVTGGSVGLVFGLALGLFTESKAVVEGDLGSGSFDLHIPAVFAVAEEDAGKRSMTIGAYLLELSF